MKQLHFFRLVVDGYPEIYVEGTNRNYWLSVMQHNYYQYKSNDNTCMVQEKQVDKWVYVAGDT